MHILFDFNKVDYNKFFKLQEGGGEFYSGRNYIRSYRQRGQGIGAVLSTLWRFAGPILKSLGKDLGAEALNTGSKFLSNVSAGEPLKEAALSHIKTGAKNVLASTSKRYLGSGKKRKIIGRNYLVKKQKDIFGI